MSHEQSIIVEIDGRYYNVPGRMLGRPPREQVPAALTGVHASQREAVAAAGARSHSFDRSPITQGPFTLIPPTQQEEGYTLIPPARPGIVGRAVRYLTEPVPFGEQPTPELRARYPTVQVPRALRFVAEGLPRALGEGYLIGGGALGARVADVAATEAVRRIISPIAARLAAPQIAAQTERVAVARAGQAERFGRPALPAPGQAFRPAITLPRPISPEDLALTAQRAENVAVGMLPPSLRQPALPSGLTRQRAPAPPAVFSRLIPTPRAAPAMPLPVTQVPSQPQRIIFPIGGGAQTQRASQFQAPRTILNRVFGGGIGDKITQAENVEAAILGPRNVAVRQAGILTLNNAENLNLLQVLEGRAAPMNPRVAQLATRFRQIATEDATDYTALGARIMATPSVRHPQTGQVVQVAQWRPFRAIQNYAPRMLDPRRVDGADPRRLTREFLASNPGLKPQDAADIVVVLKAEAAGLPIPGTVNPDILQLVKGQAFLPTHLHARTNLVLPDSVLRPMREAIPIYMEQAARERAFLRIFGPQADEQITTLAAQLGQRNPDVKLAEQVWDTYRGRFIEAETGRRQKQAAHILNNLATALLLGPQTAISQISQFGALVGRLGLPKVAQGMARVMFHGGRVEAERAGTFINSLRDEVVRLSPPGPTATALDIAEQATARFAGGVVRYSGIKAMDQFPRAVGYHAARLSLEDTRKAAMFGNMRATQALRQVGLTAQSTADEISQAASALSRRLNVTANFADLPFVLQTPLGAFARGLNTFNIQVTRMVTGEFVQPALRYAATGGREGHLRIIPFVGSSLVLGEVIGETRRAMAGRAGDRPGGTVGEFLADIQAGRVPPRTLTKRAVDDLGWAGTLGIAQNMWQSLQFAQSGTEAGARGLGTIAGAGISQAGEVGIGLPTELVRAAVAEDEGKRARRLRTAGRILTRRIPVVGGIVAPRVFRSEKADRRVAIEGAQRAMRRGDRAAAQRIIREFERRHGKSISERALSGAGR